MKEKRRNSASVSSPSSYGHHRKRRHGPLYWLRHHKTQALISGGIIAAVVLVFAYGLYRTSVNQSSKHVTAGNAHNMGSSYRNITYNGRQYQYNELITTILYAGIDSDGPLESNETCMSGPQSDSIALVVLNKGNSTMTIIPINRDTMTEVDRYKVNGSLDATITTHLALAYAFGEGGEISCNNLSSAVSNLLYGIPIDEYVITNRSSIPYINGLVDGVTVDVPNDDLAEIHSELTAGAEVHLDESNVYDYLHYRDTSADYSNEGRMERQQSYVTAYVDLFQKELEDDMDGLWKRIDDMSSYIQTSITKNKYITMANLLGKIDFTDNDYQRISGDDAKGSTYDEFYPDEDALRALVVDVFYEPV